MTREEKHLWYDFLKLLPITVNRQKNIENYIVDFYVSEKKLVIELDGTQHETSEHKKADEARDRALAEYGIRVLRYSNYDINHNFEVVIQDILFHLGLSALDVRWK